MEIKLTLTEAAQMFELWRREIEARASGRAVENGQIMLDAVPSAPGAVHQMDGSLVQVWYKAANEPTARAIAEASRATVDFGIPRQMYTGRLIDIKRNRDGQAYFMVRAIERDGEGFRCFNPSKGQLIEMVINPTAAQLANHTPPVEMVVPAVSAEPARTTLERQVIEGGAR